MGAGMGIAGAPPYSNGLNFQNFIPGAETTGSLLSSGSTWVNFATAGQCGLKLLLSNSATSGEFSTVRMRARSDAAGATICGDFSASGGANNYGNLFAVRGNAQPNAYTQTTADNIVCGLYSCIDATVASDGRRWSTWIDDHSTTKAAASHYLLRMSDNGTTAKDGAFTIYNGGRLPVLFNFEDLAGFVSTATGSATFTHKLACTISGVGTVYIPLASGIA